MRIVIIELLFIPRPLYLLRYLNQQTAPEPALAQMLVASNKQKKL